MPGLPHGASQDPLPQEYWNNLDAMYPNQLHAAPQQQNHAREQPMGISWDHPIFQQQRPQHTPPPSQRNHLQPQTDPNHGIYSIPQSWQSNPLQPPNRAFVQSPYQPQQVQQPQQVPHIQHEQIQFDSRAMNQETSSFPQYSFHPQFFPNHQLPPHGSFQERPPPQHLPSEFHAPQSNNTIDPQFLNPVLQAPSQQPQQLRDGYMFTTPTGTPTGIQQLGGQGFDYYQNDLTLQPSGNNLNNANPPKPGMLGVFRPIASSKPPGNPSRLTGPPRPEVVIEAKKAPVKKATQPKKTKAKKTKTTQESDSSDDSESDIEAPPEPSPIPLQRPTDRLEAAEYDTMQAVWAPRNKRAAPEKVKNALVVYKDLVKTLRDSWKDQVQAMKAAENSGDNEKANALKQDVTLQRGMMDRILETTLRVGHPVIVEKLGEHPVALSAMHSFIVDRFQAADYDGSLTTNILKVLARFITVDEEMLQKTNLAKVLPRFVKKGGQAVKELAQKILDNAKASTKRKQTSKSVEDSPAKAPARNSPSVEPVGLKRTREGENSAQPAKRLVVMPNPKDQSKATALNGTTKRVPDTSNGKPATAAPRPKPTHVAPKASALFSTLSSASKRPGTTNAERAAAAAAAAAAKTKKAPPKPTFSFGDLMADLDKPKEPIAVKPSEDQPPETEEERKKRLRKEERRKLRVTWKPEDSLTEIRLFTHDPEEELGPEDGPFNDGSNIKKSKLKTRNWGGTIREITLRDYYTLSTIQIELDEMKKANFIKRGGNRTPVSAEKEAQDHREATTLMVFYSSPADVPSTPKEPAAVDENEPVPDVISFGELPDTVKAKQDEYYARINPQPTPASQAPQQLNAGGGGVDIANLLKIIQNGATQQSTPPPQPVQQPPQAPMSDLERTISMFCQQQSAPPVPQVPQVPIPPAAASVDFQGILNMMKQIQQPGGFSPAQMQQTQPAMTPNLGAIFGQFAGQTNPAGGGFNSHTPGTFEDPERKRMRDGGSSHYDSQNQEQWSRGKRTKANAPPTRE
ncbi:hypothetical protein N7470_005236 [Penicillium chermesinum]|nr:hypothetical protein N7470_005236 [Penicillium chermesinum]